MVYRSIDVESPLPYSMKHLLLHFLFLAWLQLSLLPCMPPYQVSSALVHDVPFQIAVSVAHAWHDSGNLHWRVRSKEFQLVQTT